MKQTLFISYSWSDTSVADQIDLAFKPTGVYIKRDIREVEFKSSIKEYMKQIRETDFVLIVISDTFLKSANCMFEILELLKEKEFKEKCLPILVDGTKIFKPGEKLIYIQYWSDKHQELETILKSVKVTDTLNLYTDLKHYENIKSSIDEFLSLISDMKIDTISKCASENFKTIFNYIGISGRELIKRILSISNLPLENKEIEIDKIEKDFPNNGKVYAAKAIYAFNEGKITKSNYYYRKSIELDPDFSASYYNLAYNIEVFDKDFIEAKALYERAIQLNPRDTKSMNNLAGLYSKELNNPLLAKEFYEKSLKINPFDATGNYNLAVLLHDKFKKYQEARTYYEVAISLNPQFVDAKHNYALLLWKHFGEIEKSKMQFLEVLQIDGNRKRTLEQLAFLLEEKFKDYNEAKKYYEKFIKVEPNDASDHYSYATFLMLYFLPTYRDLATKHYELAYSLDKSI